MIANTSWFQQQLDTTLHIMHPGGSDHALLWLGNKETLQPIRPHFNYFNCMVDMEGYAEKVKDNLNFPINGRPMYVVWEKLKRLPGVMRTMNKPMITLKQNIIKAREELETTHHDLNLDLMDRDRVHKVQTCTTKLLALIEF